MKLTVLGYQSPYPGPGGATPGYLVETDQMKILLDCGSGVISQLGQYIQPWELDAVILSHLHHDHTSDISILQYAIMMGTMMNRRNKPLPVYAPDQPKEKWRHLFYKNYLDVGPVDQQTTLQLADMNVQFLRTDHPVPCYAAKLENKGKKVIYGADSGPATKWSPFADKADLFICESTYLPENIPEGKRAHLSIDEAFAIAEEIRCNLLLLTHFSPTYDREKIQRLVNDIRSNISFALAECGLQIDLSKLDKGE